LYRLRLHIEPIRKGGVRGCSLSGSVRPTRAVRKFGDDSLQLTDDPRVVDLAGGIAVAACYRDRVARDVGAVRPQHES
jgi:hypothetical protein